MKKYLIWTVIICFMVSMMFIGSACKTEEVVEEEAVEETAEEEVVEEEAAEETVEEEAVEEGITDEPITINMWALGGTEIKIFTAIAEKYMEEHPNVTLNVTQQGSTYMRGNAPIAVASGQEELDILWFWSNLGQSMASKGLLLDLAPYHEEYGWWDKLQPSQREPMTSPDGGTYFLSYGHVIMPVVWYNLDIFEELGAEIPTTVDEMNQIAKDSIAAGLGGIAYPTRFWEWHMNAFTSIFMSDEEKEILGRWSYLTIKEKAENIELWKTSKGLRESFEYIKSSTEDGVYAPGMSTLDWQQSWTYFAEGLSPMFWGHSAMSHLLYGVNPDLNLGVFPFPESKVNDYLGNSICVPAYVAEKSPEKIPVIMDIIDSILEPDYQKIIVSFGLIPGGSLITSEMIKEVADPLTYEISLFADKVGVTSAFHYGLTRSLEQGMNDVGAQIATGIIDIDGAIEFIYNLAVDDVKSSSW